MRPVLKPRQLPIRVWLVLTLIALSSFTGFALPASITSHPANISRCPGSGASFSVTAMNPLTYQWQVNTGSGFEDIVDGDPYSGATTATLNVSSLLDEYSGYQFQCVVTGVSGPDAISNTATLTVAELLVDLIQTDATCNEASDGTATVTVTGGSGVYTYLWTETGNTGSTETDMLAGTYHCQVTDESGCTVTQEVIINEPSPIVATVSFIDISCYGMNDGAASVSVTGGAGSYSYYWYPEGSTGSSVSNLPPDEYTCSITDANGCGISENITITEPSQLVAVQSQDDVVCPGGTTGMATVTVTGGSGSYTYNWFPSGGNDATASDLAAGEYTCTITDEAGCSIFEYFTISETAGPDISPTITDVLCAGNSNGKISLSVTGPGTPYTFYWTGSGNTGSEETDLAAGEYECQITDGSGCSVNETFTVAQPALFTATTSTTPVTCFGANDGTATITPAGGALPFSYSWLNGQTTQVATNLAPVATGCFVTDANGCAIYTGVAVSGPAALTATATQVDASCSGASGSATVTAAGGTGPYTYSWSPSGGNGATASGLTPGIYTYTITDNHACSFASTVTIGSSALVTATSTQTNVLCNGSNTGSATITASGGSGIYTYSWSPSGGTGATAAGLGAGTYTCTINSSDGCSTTETVTINAPTSLSIVKSSTAVSCAASANGTATLVVSGGTPGYIYSWSNGQTTATATDLTKGIHSCFIIDQHGCASLELVTVDGPNALAVSTSQVDATCGGAGPGSATVTVSGGALPYSYSWSASGGTAATATGLAPGAHTCTITDNNGCVIIASVTITATSVVTATSTQTNVLCHGGTNGSATVTATGASGTYTYSWLPSGGTGATATGLAAGAYTCTVSSSDGCSTTETVTITEPDALVVTPTITNVNCAGMHSGIISLAVTGGTGPYTYSWTTSGNHAATESGLSGGSYECTISDANGCSVTETYNVTEPTSLSIVQSSTAVSCAGSANGTATLLVSGGTPAYTYSWSNGQTTATATGLTKGTHSCFIIDQHGCPSLELVTVSGPNALAVSTTQVDATCGGANPGSATVAVSGGTLPYSYSWSASGGTAATATGLAAGAYSCTITDNNGCTITANVTITASSGVSATSTQTNVLCHGGINGSATLTATGASGTYTYSWSPSGGTDATATGLAAGTYTCTISSSDGCSTTQAVTITEPDAFIVTPAFTNITCAGASNGSASVSGSGGTGLYTYLWAPGGQTTSSISDLAAGTYTCTVTDANGCTTGEAITISSPSVLTTSLSQTNISCNGGANGSATIAASGGTSSYTYSWSPSGGTGATVTGLVAGTYTATVTDANGCTAMGAVTLTEPSAIVLTGTSVDASCTGLPDGSASVAATGGAGSYTYSWSPSGGTSATATGLVNGSYTVTVTDANGCTATNSYVLDGAPLPTVDPVAGEVLCNNATTAAVVFSGSAIVPTTYNWVNDDASIGLPASGSGDIAAFVASNTSASVITATITVTPIANGCDGAPQVFTIAVKPTPGVAPVADQDICAGSGTTNIGIGGPIPGATYNWTNSNTAIGLPATGSGDIPSFTALNATGNTLSASITITPTLNGCTGADEVFLINVNAPSADPVGITASASELCGPGTVNLSVTGGSLGSGANWKWYTGSCGGTPVGTGTTLSDIQVNTTTTYFVRAEGTCNTTDCASTTITVNSKPAMQLTSAGHLALQPGMTTKLTAAQTPVATGDVYTWYRNGEQVAGLNAATFNVSIDTRGAYKVKVSTALGCETVSNEIVIRDSVSSRLYVLPNPNNGMFKVRYYSPSIFYGKRHMTIYNGRGELVYNKIFVVNDAYTVLDVNVMGVAQGVYFIIIGDANNRVLSKERLEIF